MDRLEAMGLFVSVADLRGFAPAARRHRISPSVVTRTVAALEERLGTRLLHRTTRSVTLTDAGTRYLERARRIVDDAREADESARAERSAPRGRLVVSAPTLFGRLHVAPLVSSYLADHPDVTAELQLTDRVVNLVDDGIDLAVRIGALEDASYVARAVGETRSVIVGSPAYLARRKRPRTPDDLRHHDTIQLTSLVPTREWRFGSTRVSLASRFVTNSADAAIAQAELGGGLTRALSYQVQGAVRAGRLEIVLARHEGPPLPIHVVYPTTRLLSASVRALVDAIARSCDWRFTLR